MGTMFDVIGGLLIFAAVVVMTLNLNFFTLENNAQSTLQNATMEAIKGTESTSGLSDIIEQDLRMIGAGDSVSPSIILADSDRITFRGDVTGNGNVDSVKYFVTNPGSVPAGTNPNLKQLYRRQNTESGTDGWWGVSSFQLLYLDAMGRTIPSPVPSADLPSIRSVKVLLALESKIRLKSAVDTNYAATYWETLISPPNVR